MFGGIFQLYLSREKILYFPAGSVLCRLSRGNDKQLTITLIFRDVTDFFLINPIGDMLLLKSFVKGLLCYIRPVPFRFPYHHGCFHFIICYSKLQGRIPGWDDLFFRFCRHFIRVRFFRAPASGVQLPLLLQLRFIPVFHGFNQGLRLRFPRYIRLFGKLPICLLRNCFSAILHMFLFIVPPVVRQRGFLLCFFFLPIFPEVFHKQIIKQTFFLHGNSPLPVDVPVFRPFASLISDY